MRYSPSMIKLQLMKTSESGGCLGSTRPTISFANTSGSRTSTSVWDKPIAFEDVQTASFQDWSTAQHLSAHVKAVNQIITTRLAHEFPSYTTYVTVPGVMCLVFMALFIACPVFAMTQMSSSFASTSPAPIAFGLAACFLVLIAITAAVFSYRGKRERQQFWCKFEAVVKEKLNEINMTDEILIASNQLWSIQTEEYISGIQINHHHNDNFHNSASVVWNTDYYLILIPKHIGSFFSQQTAVEQEQQYQQADHHLVEVPLFAQRHQRPYPMDVSGDAYPIPLNGTHHQPPPPPAYSANK